MTPGPILRSHRKRCRLTLAAVATQTGLSLSYISDIEHGRSGGSLRALAVLAAAYGVTLDSLFSVEPIDDVQDVLAVHPRPFELIADDYEFYAGAAGDLGGVEW